MRDPMSEPNEQDYADQATRRMTAKREWVEYRVIGTKPWVGNGPSFEYRKHAEEYVKAWMGKGEAGSG